MRSAPESLVSKNGKKIFYLLVRCRTKVRNSVNNER